jgi:GT2 family glycosyltransferase
MPDDRRLVSIIIPCFNQWRYTKLCLESVFRHTTHPFELIVIDNGSRDRTAKHLAMIRRRNTPDGKILTGFRIIVNKKNKGVSAALNQGISVARGQYICYLNNDTIVTGGWLHGLVACAERDAAIGLVGCSVNLLEHYDSVGNEREIQRTAVALSLLHRGQYENAHFVHGFCMLVKRKVIDRIGMFDERFYPCTGDDLDYSLRARKAGFRLVNAKDVFVYHFMSKATLAPDFNAAYGSIDTVTRKFFRRFLHKWGVAGMRFLQVYLRNKADSIYRLHCEIYLTERRKIRRRLDGRMHSAHDFAGVYRANAMIDDCGYTGRPQW